MTLKELAKRATDVIKSGFEPTEAQLMIANYHKETKNGKNGRVFDYNSKPSDFSTGRIILGSDLQTQMEVLRELLKHKNKPDSPFYVLEAQLLTRKLPLSLSDVETLLERAVLIGSWGGHWGAAMRRVQNYLTEGGQLTSSLKTSLKALQEQANHYNSPENRKFALQTAELLGAVSVNKPELGEAWTDKALADLAAMSLEVRTEWETVFAHATTAEGTKPSAKWLAEAARHRQTIGVNEFDERLSGWLNLFALPPSFDQAAPADNDAHLLMTVKAVKEASEFQTAYLDYSKKLKEFQKEQGQIVYKNQILLKGLTWYSATSTSPEIARGLMHMTQIAFTSIVTQAAFSQSTERGTYSSKLGNAGIWALGQMPGGVGVGPLAILRTRLRDRGALKLITAAIEAAAKAAGMTVDELEDLTVPTGGLDADETRMETFGAEGSARLTLDGATGRTRSEWFGADGKVRKAVPAGVKREFAAEVKALKAAEEEVSAAVSAQAARFDRALLEERTLPLGVWRERYGSHPVLSNLARRLIWTVGGAAVLPVGEGFADASGKTLDGLADDAPITLWHPINAEPKEVLRWRDALEARGLVQPFKQAHREVYLLTDAERATATYSNRFAAHILKQHQFNSLCILRGWKNTLRLMVDDSYPPATRALPQFGLRAEFWVEGIGDNYGTDTNDAGTYLRLATDQVRFYADTAEMHYAHAGGGGYGPPWGQMPADPVLLSDVPPLVLSEVMRDVDLFVGVASVGNDPAWADGGLEGRFRDYWQDYAFGDLSETAKTRAAVLAKLLPRLKIASRCRIDGKFLVVRGDVRTYKIHLGSGNILMEPDDRYLCIVPGRSEDTGDVFLPFEGDRVLAIVLSKAFLLADDTKITDLTIVSQIKSPRVLLAP